MKAQKTLLVVIATYNEFENLPTLVEKLLEVDDSIRILVVDDNSPDGTGRWCDSAASHDSRLHVVHRPQKLGLGSATKLGLQEAISQRFDLVATMDADLSHDPAALAEMLGKFSGDPNGGPDVVIGSRYVQGGEILGWPWYRRLSSYLVNLFARAILGLPTRDNTSAYRVYRVAKLREIKFQAIESSGYSYLEEILMLLKNERAEFDEVPIRFTNREKGESKVDFVELARSLYQILRLSLKRKSPI